MSVFPAPTPVAAAAAAGPAWAAPLRARWMQLAARERLAVTIAAWGLALFLLWSLAVAPALKTLREAPVRQAELDAQFDQMRRLADEAQALRQMPGLPPAQAEAALRASVQRLGDRARLQMQGDRATVALQGLTGSEFTAFLAEARAGARAKPVQAQLVRNATAGYNGTLVLAIGFGI